MKFPKDFMWGGATAANQCEGGYLTDGSGSGVIDFVPGGKERMKIALDPKFDFKEDKNKYNYPNRHGNDFYHRYEEDIDLMAGMGFRTYRMAISWPRIFPNANDATPNEKGLEFYDKVFKKLRSVNIEPLVTISHYDIPMNLIQNLGGWGNPESIDLFVKYSTTIMERYKGLVKYWITFNEINSSPMFPMFSLGSNYNDSENRMQDIYQSLHHQFVASAKTIEAGRKINPDFKFADMSLSVLSYSKDANPINQVHNLLAIRMVKYFCSDVQIRGYYPQYALNYFKENNIELKITEEEKNILKNNVVDFHTFSYYMSFVDSTEGDVSGNMMGGGKNEFLESSEWGWQIDPQGMRIILNEFYDRYQIPLVIVENGLGANDVLTEDKKVHDTYRIDYLKKHIEALDQAIEDGVDVRGYTPWGWIDLVSASTGEMSKRYGFVYVDADDAGNGTFDRYKKDSYDWYKKVIESNGEKL